MRPVLALDPGTSRTAYVLFADGRILAHGIERNDSLLEMLRGTSPSIVPPFLPGPEAPILVVEMIASYGMSVGAEVFETCVWIGRFLQAWAGLSTRVYRREVKMFLCGSMRAKDGNIRQALLDLLGPQGTKREPGPTYGIKADEWAALGVAVTYADFASKGIAA